MRRDDLVEAINKAFVVHGPFTPQEISDCPCPECDEVRADFAELSTDEIANEVIDRNFDKLPLLSTEAMVAFLPRFMLRAVEGASTAQMGSDVLEFTTYHLLPPKAEDSPKRRAWQEAGHAALSAAQARVIMTFLRHSHEIDPCSLDEDELEATLQYWAARH